MKFLFEVESYIFFILFFFYVGYVNFFYQSKDSRTSDILTAMIFCLPKIIEVLKLLLLLLLYSSSMTIILIIIMIMSV
jgi:hypothetical protein